jgi:hypothetical protein
VAIVYIHKRPDNKQVFYVGIAKNKSRATETKKYRRNYLWNRVYKEVGFISEITHQDLVWEEACKIEQYLISFYKENSKNDLCNLTDGGDGTLGLKVPEERKLLYSKMYKGVKRSEEDIKKMRKPKTSGTNTLKGTKLSEEHKLKLSLHFKGKKKGSFTEEHKLNISLARKGINFSDEHRKKISDSLRLRIVTEETKEKMRISHLGKKYKMK